MSDMMQLYSKEMEGNRDDGNRTTVIDVQTEWNDTYIVHSSAYTKYMEEFNNLLIVHIHSSQSEFEASLERLGILTTKKGKTVEDITEEKAEQKDKSSDHSEDLIYNVSTAKEERNNETQITSSASSFLEYQIYGVRLLSTVSSPLLERSKYTVGLLSTASSSFENRQKYKFGLLSTALSAPEIKGIIVKYQKEEVDIVDSTDCLCMPLLQIVRRIRNRLLGKKNGTHKSDSSKSSSVERC